MTPRELSSLLAYRYIVPWYFSVCAQDREDPEPETVTGDCERREMGVHLPHKELQGELGNVAGWALPSSVAA